MRRILNPDSPLHYLPKKFGGEKFAHLMMNRDIKVQSPGLFKEIINMPLRARVGRTNSKMDRTTICYIIDQKRNAFISVNDLDDTEELTFLETVKIFEAEKAKDLKVGVTQGPNEKRAIAYLDAMQDLLFTNEEERALIIKAKEAIRQGRFQRLQRDINKLKPAVNKSPLKPAIILDRIVEILKSYPLQTIHEEDGEVPKMVLKKSLNPEIIISESFLK